MMKKVAEFLAGRTEEILAAAVAAMDRSHLPRYEQAGPEVARERLRALYALVVRCAEERRLAPIVDHAARIAQERHAAGIDLGQVQTAINVLEEAIWRAVLEELPAEEQGETLGVVATILGAAKDTLACSYVALAGEGRRRSLNLAVLFEGPGEGEAPRSPW